MSFQKIKGLMADGKSSRFIQVDAEGRLILAPQGIGTLKRISVTKRIAGGTEDANDVISESTSLGRAWDFDGIASKRGGTGYIVKASVISESEGATPRLTLFLFNAIPTSNLNDDAANAAPDAADLDKYVGKIDFPAMESLGTTDSNALVTPSTTGNLPLAFQCVRSSANLYGILVTRDAFTQTATDDMTVVLLAEQF